MSITGCGSLSHRTLVSWGFIREVKSCDLFYGNSRRHSGICCIVIACRLSWRKCVVKCEGGTLKAH